MIASLPRPLSKLAALLLLALALAAAALFIAAPLAQTLLGLDAAVKDKRATLGRLADTRRAEAEAQSLALSLSRSQAESLYLPGDSDAMRFANLQTALTAIAEAQGVRLRSTRAIKPAEAGGPALVAAAASFEASMAQLQEMLLAIDRHEPMLIAADIRIVPAASAADAGETLEVELEVRAPVADNKG